MPLSGDVQDLGASVPETPGSPIPDFKNIVIAYLHITGKVISTDPAFLLLMAEASEKKGPAKEGAWYSACLNDGCEQYKRRFLSDEGPEHLTDFLIKHMQRTHNEKYTIQRESHSNSKPNFNDTGQTVEIPTSSLNNEAPSTLVKSLVQPFAQATISVDSTKIIEPFSSQEHPTQVTTEEPPTGTTTAKTDTGRIAQAHEVAPIPDPQLGSWTWKPLPGLQGVRTCSQSAATISRPSSPCANRWGR